ncbi:SIP domain-containing protein [Achromobacter insuavis]
MQPFSPTRRDVPCIVLRALDLARDMRRLTLGGPNQRLAGAPRRRPARRLGQGVPARRAGPGLYPARDRLRGVHPGNRLRDPWRRPRHRLRLGAARPGDAVSIAGPRDGGFALQADTRWVWLGADASAFGRRPAASSNRCRPPSRSWGCAIRRAPTGPPSPARTRRDGPRAACRPARMKCPAPCGPGQVWLAGQAGWVKAWRAHWLQRLRLDAARVSAKGYWKDGEQDYKE